MEQISNKKLWINRAIFEKPFFEKLSPLAVKLYLVFLLKCKWEPVHYTGNPRKHKKDDYRIKNNGEIEFTYSEAEKYCSEKTFDKKLDELNDFGLIDITYSGIGIRREKSKYGISERWRKYGTLEFETKKRVKRYSRKKAKKNFPTVKSTIDNR